MKPFLLVFFLCIQTVILFCNDQIDRLQVVLASVPEIDLGMDVDIHRMKKSI